MLDEKAHSTFIPTDLAMVEYLLKSFLMRSLNSLDDMGKGPQPKRPKLFCTWMARATSPITLL